jgi:dGTPase
MDDIESENRSSVIFTGFLEDMSEDYIQNHCKEEIVRDFIAGMTDQYLIYKKTDLMMNWKAINKNILEL